MTFFTNLISSKLRILYTNFLGPFSVPREAFTGVLVSLRKIIVAKKKHKSTIVFHNIFKAKHNHKKQLNNQNELLFSNNFFFFLSSVGNVGTAFGSEVFRVQARTRDIRETPSPIEWCIRKIAMELASFVLMFRMWISHSGFVKSMGV